MTDTTDLKARIEKWPEDEGVQLLLPWSTYELVADMEARIEQLEADKAALVEALKRLRDCDWVISLPDRMDAVRDIARQALKEITNG